MGAGSTTPELPCQLTEQLPPLPGGTGTSSECLQPLSPTQIVGQQQDSCSLGAARRYPCLSRCLPAPLHSCITAQCPGGPRTGETPFPEVSGDGQLQEPGLPRDGAGQALYATAKVQLSRKPGRTEYLLPPVQPPTGLPLQQPCSKVASATGKVLVPVGADVGLN